MAIPPVPPVPDADRIFQVFPDNQPIDFLDVPFPIYGDGTDIVVSVNGVDQTPDKWRFISKSGEPIASLSQPITDGRITFVKTVYAE